MVISKFKINSYLLFIIFSLSFLGYYAITLLSVNAGMGGYTRQISIPVRMIIGAALMGLLFMNYKRINISHATIAYFLFASFYVARVIMDYVLGNKHSISTTEVLFYFISFSVIPFISVSSFSIRKEYFPPIVNALLITAFIFSFFSFIFYRDFIGQASRVTSSRVAEDVVSPLILSYCSTFIIGVLGFYFLYNKTNLLTKTIGFLAIGFSIIPFFLGASRGSLIALFFPILLMGFSRMNYKTIVRIVVVIAMLIFGITLLDDSFGSGLIDRFIGTSQAVEEGSSSASRLLIWEISLNQFYDHPFFGDKLKPDYSVSYPHNIIVEVLQTTGIVGFIPFLFLVISSLYYCTSIYKNHIEYSWVAVIFLQSLSQNMFSGALYTAAWLWTSMALLYATKRYLCARYKLI